jgi:hypothetical protein
VASKVMRKLPDWACANGVLAHVPDDKKQTCEFTVELKLAGEAIDSRNKAASEAINFFFVTKFFFVAEFFVVTKFFFVTGTIVPIPIPCAGLRMEAGLFVCSEVQKGVSDADAEWGSVLLATTGGAVRMRSVKNGLESY